LSPGAISRPIPKSAANENARALLPGKNYLFLHFEATLRNPLSPFIKASFFVRDHRFI